VIVSDLETLRKRFLVDEDVAKARLEQLLEKVLPYCVVDRKGAVHVQVDIAARNRLKLILTARAIAALIETSITAEVSIDDLAQFSGLPKNQVTARTSDIVKEKFAESVRPGVLRAYGHKLEGFLDSLKESSNASVS
jgi:hypothetical protein